MSSRPDAVTIPTGTDAPLSAGEVRVYTLLDSGRERARLAMRQLLAETLGVGLETVELEYGPKGKPVLRTDPTLHFSVSHAAAVSMIAITRVAPVGVDVERVRVVPQAEAILRRLLPPEEATAMSGAGDRNARFVRLWTRAEATVKVRGASVWEAATPDSSVTVRDVAAPEGFAASVAVAAAEWHLTQVMYPRDGALGRGCRVTGSG